MAIKRRWPPYGSNFSSGTTDAIGILVETYNDCERALQFILLSFMRGDIWHNFLVVEHMSSTAVIEAIRGYLMEAKEKKNIQDAVEFSVKSFEICRANRNSIIHFGTAWRDSGKHKTRLMRVKLRSGRQSLTRVLKVGDVRAVADASQELKIYMDNLSVSLDEHFKRKKFKEHPRPKPAKLLAWNKAPY
jgi:hypothetical protein